jgi:hypothetical protein
MGKTGGKTNGQTFSLKIAQKWSKSGILFYPQDRLKCRLDKEKAPFYWGL